jgi:hypothetical protein
VLGKLEKVEESAFVCRALSGSSSVGRAIAFQAIGREFEPRLPLRRKTAGVRLVEI